MFKIKNKTILTLMESYAANASVFMNFKTSITQKNAFAVKKVLVLMSFTIKSKTLKSFHDFFLVRFGIFVTVRQVYKGARES